MEISSLSSDIEKALEVIILIILITKKNPGNNENNHFSLACQRTEVKEQTTSQTLERYLQGGQKT